MRIMDEMIEKSAFSDHAVKDLLHDGVIEINGSTGRRMRFGFMAALEHEGDLYVVLTKLTKKKQINHELLLLRMLKTDGKIDNYEVVHDPLEATTLIDQYIHLAVQALFEDVAVEGEEGTSDEDAAWDMDEEDESESVLH